MDHARAAEAERSFLILKITVRESPEAVTLILEGRLAGPWIWEVERAWSAITTKIRGLHLVVDLSGVSFIEAEGKTLLRRISEQEGELRADDVMTKAIIEEVQGRGSNTV